MGVFQFFIPPERIPEMKAEGFNVVISQEENKCTISITFDKEPGPMLSGQLDMLDKSQKGHLALIIAVLRHGGKVAIDSEVFNTKFRKPDKEEDPDFPGITTI